MNRQYSIVSQKHHNAKMHATRRSVLDIDISVPAPYLVDLSPPPRSSEIDGNDFLNV